MLPPCVANELLSWVLSAARRADRDIAWNREKDTTDIHNWLPPRRNKARSVTVVKNGGFAPRAHLDCHSLFVSLIAAVQQRCGDHDDEDAYSNCDRQEHIHDEWIVRLRLEQALDTRQCRDRAASDFRSLPNPLIKNSCSSCFKDA
jgi:hypothetical protein